MIGQTISHYNVLEKLGEGGMGVVYKARDTRLDRFVALKFLPHHLTASSDDRERFAIEAKAAAALNHPNIATIHAVEESGGETFIVMEYIEGTELKSRLRSGPPSMDQVIAIARQIAEGLRAAHDREIVHRDIKSANIMITAGDHVKIMDFGLAKIRGGSQVTRAGSTVGTASYMSPEQARGGEVDRRSDLWSFGVVMYELLTGQLPFASDYEQAVVYSILNETPKPVASLRKDVPPAIARIVERAMTKDPASRYQSAQEILDDLGSRAHGAAGPTTVRA
ncbi:MAG TPA: serine/threonine-protein kinase, partial [Candidatus Krumholzibacterium sp.]|nr:serine/threonine-protein kinase [Candidatus Krumholzibacterium sp.]